MQIGAAPSRLAGRIDPYPLRTAYDADQRPLGQDCTAAYTGPMSNVFPSNSLLRHPVNSWANEIQFLSFNYHPSSQPSSGRLRFF